MDKQIDVMKIFTKKMINDAENCINVSEIRKKVIEPNMIMINEKTGQENDAGYWSYLMEHVLIVLKKRH